MRRHTLPSDLTEASHKLPQQTTSLVLKGWLTSQRTNEIRTDVAVLTGGDFEKGPQFVQLPGEVQ